MIPRPRPIKVGLECSKLSWEFYGGVISRGKGSKFQWSQRSSPITEESIIGLAFINVTKTPVRRQLLVAIAKCEGQLWSTYLQILPKAVLSRPDLENSSATWCSLNESPAASKFLNIA